MTKYQIPKNISELAQKRASQFYKRFHQSEPEDLAVGQIWSTKDEIVLENKQVFSSNEPRIIVILDIQNGSLVAAPISIETQMAGEFDFIVRDADSPLEFDFLVEVWNEIPVLSDHLNRYLSSLSDSLTNLLQELHAAYLLENEINETLKQYIGLSIHERDARLEFQESEVKAVHYLSQASTFALSIPKAVKQSIKSRILDFGIPVLQSLSDLFKSQRQGFAFASGGDSKIEDKGYMIFFDTQDPTIMEISVSKRRYVYLLVHRVGQQLENQEVVIRLSVKDKKLVSEPVSLAVRKRIDLGEYKGFKSDDIEDPVMVEIV
jgi:hypothetical protein